MIVDNYVGLNECLDVQFSNRTYAHTCGSKLQPRRDTQAIEMALHVQDSDLQFDSMNIDTGANHRNFMSLKQYLSYYKEYCVPASATRDLHSIHRMGSKHCTIGTAVISILFPIFSLVFDVAFHITNEDFSTLLNRQYLQDPKIDQSVQLDCLNVMGRGQKLSIENAFLVYI